MDAKFDHFWIIFLVVSGLFLVLSVGCSSEGEESHFSPSTLKTNAVNSISLMEEDQSTILVPKEFRSGEERFNVLCSRCHGLHARGTGNGPPLVHKIYEPSHHGDFAFKRAAAQGVRAHHWEFGNMPKITGVLSSDVALIIQYVRWLQREAGIY